MNLKILFSLLLALISTSALAGPMTNADVIKMVSAGLDESIITTAISAAEPKFDGVALSLNNTTLSRVSGCVLRDDRAERNSAPALKVVGGRGNTITGNVVDRPPQIAPESGTSRDNEIVTRSEKTSP